MELERNKPSEGFSKKRRIEVSSHVSRISRKASVKIVWYSLIEGDRDQILADVTLEANEAEDLATMLMYYAKEVRDDGIQAS